MRQQIDRRALERITQARNVEDLSARELVELFREEEGLADYLPDGTWEIDPRSGDRRRRMPRSRRRRNDRASSARATLPVSSTSPS
jgi:hypothetical protein